MKLKIAAIQPRKPTPKKTVKPSVKKKLNETKTKDKNEKQKLSESSSSSDSCSKCSSDSSSEDDLPLKAVKKNLPSKCSPQKPLKSRNVIKSDSDEELCDNKDNVKIKDKPSSSKTIVNVKKNKSEESTDNNVKKAPGRRTKVSL